MEPNYEICGKKDWVICYRGKIRDGTYGNLTGDATIFGCNNCQNRRLEDKFCVNPTIYETAEYRQKLEQDIASETFHRTHNAMASYFLSVLDPFDLNEKVVMGIGSGGGHLLEAIGDRPSKKIAIEPTPNFHSILTKKGFAIICTPNADDIMLDMLPDDYPYFFYRTVHRFYVNAKSLTEAGRQAGLETTNISYLQRYHMDNASFWLRDRYPSGTKSFSPIKEAMSKMWKERLEELGRAGCIYAIYRKRTNVG